MKDRRHPKQAIFSHNFLVLFVYCFSPSVWFHPFTYITLRLLLLSVVSTVCLNRFWDGGATFYDKCPVALVNNEIQSYRRCCVQMHSTYPNHTKPSSHQPCPALPTFAPTLIAASHRKHFGNPASYPICAVNATLFATTIGYHQ